MEEEADKAPSPDAFEPERRRRLPSWPIFVGTLVGAASGMQLAVWVGRRLSGGLDLGGPIWTLTLVLSLVFGAMAGGLIADYIRKRH